MVWGALPGLLLLPVAIIALLRREFPNRRRFVAFSSLLALATANTVFWLAYLPLPWGAPTLIILVTASIATIPWHVIPERLRALAFGSLLVQTTLQWGISALATLLWWTA